MTSRSDGPSGDTAAVRETDPGEADPVAHPKLGLTTEERERAQAAHPFSIESDDKMCLDQFEREFWRYVCPKCGHTGLWRFWRSQTSDDWIAHVVDIAYAVRGVISR